MKILLLNPPGNEYVRAGSRWPHKRKIKLKCSSYFPFPFALAYAASNLKNKGYEVQLKDCPVLHWNQNSLKEFISQFKPDLIFMETSAPSYAADIQTVKNINTIPVCAMGFHASALPELHIKDGFTYVFKGEYEDYIAEFIKALEKGNNLPPYVCSIDNPEVEHAPLTEDIDTWAYPLRDDMPMKLYHDPFSTGFNITIISSKGCPFNCSFCTLTPYLGKTRYRTRKPEKVVDEIIYLKNKFHPDEFMFDDDTITVSSNHLISLCREMIKRAPGTQWSCMGNIPIDEECARWMAKAGCRAIKLGVESGVQEVLDRIPKKITLEQVIQTFAILKKCGIKRHATIMMGLPGETIEFSRKTVDFVLALDPDTVQFSTATPYPGTRLYNEAIKNGWISEKDYGFFDGAGLTPLSYPLFTKDKIIKAYKNGKRKWHRFMLFHKPGTVLHHLKNMIYKRI